MTFFEVCWSGCRFERMYARVVKAFASQPDADAHCSAINERLDDLMIELEEAQAAVRSAEEKIEKECGLRPSEYTRNGVVEPADFFVREALVVDWTTSPVE